MFIEQIRLQPLRALGKTYQTVVTTGKFKGNDIKIMNNYVNGKLRSKVCTTSSPNKMHTFWKSYNEAGRVEERSSGYGLKLDINA